VSKTKTAAAAVPRLADVPAYASLVARQSEVGRELDAAKAELADLSRPAEAAWKQAVATAIADGKPVPPRPTIGGADELAQRIEDLEAGLGLIRDRLRGVVERESLRLLGETAGRRAELVRAQHDALVELIAKAREYQGLRNELDAAGVKTALVGWAILHQVDDLEAILHDFRRNAPAGILA
jgi:hypothetical protein